VSVESTSESRSASSERIRTPLGTRWIFGLKRERIVEVTMALGAAKPSGKKSSRESRLGSGAQVALGWIRCSGRVYG